MTNKLTIRQRRLLIHVRQHGAVFGERAFPGSHQGGGSVRRMTERLVKMKLLAGPPPFTITKEGLGAINHYRNDGSVLSKFYLSGYDPEIFTRRKWGWEGVEVAAFLKTGGDTVALLRFMHDGRVELWRDTHHVTTCPNIGQVYAYAEKFGKAW